MYGTVRTLKGNPGVVLEAANTLNPNLQFTIEELDSNGNMAFFVLYVNKDSTRKPSICMTTWNFYCDIRVERLAILID